MVELVAYVDDWQKAMKTNHRYSVSVFSQDV